MILQIDVKLLEKSRLSIQKFVYLQTLVEEIDYDFEEIYDHSYIEMVVELQNDMYIKVINNEVYPRQKALDLFKVKQEDITFEEFWEKFHTITSRSKTDRVPAEKHWNKLTKKYKKLAFDKIEPYFDSLDNTKYCKKARTYLADKNFLDEFVSNKEADDPFINKA